MRSVLVALAMAVLLLAGPLSLSAVAPPSTAHVRNRAPAYISNTLAASVTPSSGSSVTVSFTVTFEDENGQNDLSDVNVRVYDTDNATLIVTTFAATKTSGSGRQATFSASFTMAFWRDPGTYYVRVDASDGNAADDTTVWLTFTYESLSALSLSTSTVGLGPGGSSTSTVEPGQDTTASPASVTVTNSGNVRMDLQFSGTALTNSTLGTTIPVSNVRYSRASDMSSASTFSTSAQTDATFDLGKGSGSTKTAYFTVSVPSGTRSGVYTGTVTLAAVQG